MRHTKLALSALIFYLIMFTIWTTFDVIPSPTEFIPILEHFYEQYGLLSLFIAVFLEAIVYFGLYFPGSFILLLIVISSGGTFQELIIITLISTIAVTLANIINYALGYLNIIKLTKSKKNSLNKVKNKRNLILACLHPNFLAFYTLNKGINKESPLIIFLTPLFLIPYIFLMVLILFIFRDLIIQEAENPYTMIGLILIWILIALYFDNRNKIDTYIKIRTTNIFKK